MTCASPPPRHEGVRHAAIRLGIAALVVPLLAGVGSSRAAATGILPGANPRANVAPSPDFLVSGTCAGTPGHVRCANPCVTAAPAFPTLSEGAGCVAYVERAIDHARASEGVAALALPTNFSARTPREQLFVLADLERTARGLPPYLGLNAALSAEAQHAARTGADPGLAPGFAAGADRGGAAAMGGAWATAFSTLAADYLWMYDDGWGGSLTATANLACTSARAAGCWAHRDELLGADPRLSPGVGLRCGDCEMGTGVAIVDGHASLVDLVERPSGATPTMTFTWARDVAPYLPRATAGATALARAEARRTAVHGAWPTWNDGGTPLACRSPGARLDGRLACRATTFTTGRHRVGSLDKEE